MTAIELEHRLDMLGALEAFRRNLWHEWQETLSEHVSHMNRIGVSDMYGYVFMALHWEGSPEGFEYWHAVANAFGRKETTLIINGNSDEKNYQGHDHRGQE